MWAAPPLKWKTLLGFWTLVSKAFCWLRTVRWAWAYLNCASEEGLELVELIVRVRWNRRMHCGVDRHRCGS